MNPGARGAYLVVTGAPQTVVNYHAQQAKKWLIEQIKHRSFLALL